MVSACIRILSVTSIETLLVLLFAVNMKLGKMCVQNGYNGSKLFLHNGKESVINDDLNDIEEFRKSLVSKEGNENSENTISRISTASKHSTKDDFVKKFPFRTIAELLDVEQSLVGRSAYQLCDKYGKAAADESFPTEILALIGKRFAFKVAIDEFNAKKLLSVFNVLRFSGDPDIIDSLIVSATPNKPENEATKSPKTPCLYSSGSVKFEQMIDTILRSDSFFEKS
ncbi:hypothetical protein Tco_1229094 [Tanacetum coccineum]